MVRYIIAGVFAGIHILLFAFAIIRTRIQRIVRNALYWFVKKDGLLFSVAFLAAVIFYSNNSNNNDTLIDSKQFSSIAISVIIAWSVLLIKSFLIGYLEDPLKLTEDYEGLVQKFKGDWLENDKKERFPVIKDADLFQKMWIIIDHPYWHYKLPDEIHGYEPELMAAHKQKNNYNHLAIRVYKWEWDSNKQIFNIYTGRTTYYNSLLTNRAMDYKLTNGYSIRDILSLGPGIPDLENSKLSNQIGVNGFLVSSDDYVCLVLRRSDLAIGKRTYGTSISGDIHTRYEMGINNKLKVDENGVLKSIQKTYITELRLREGNKKDDELLAIGEIKVLAAYRDIVEGNKPQFLTFVKSKKTKEYINKIFEGNRNQPASKGERSDGDKLVWIYMGNLMCGTVCIHPTKIKDGKKEYVMVPSASGALLMFAKWADKNYRCR